MYSALSGSNWSRNHSRCWAKDRERGPSRGRTGIVGTTAEPSVTASAGSAAASPATVGVVNSARGETSTPKAARSREITRMLRMESPPSSKKLSSTPTRSTPSTSAQIPASVASASVRGAT